VFKPGGSGFVTQDGSLGMKLGWRRGVRGHLTIEGRRLDGPALALRARIPDGYGDFGFQSTYVIFSTPGCWEVTGRVGDASLTFVTNVVKIGEGPTRFDPEGIERRPPPNTALHPTAGGPPMTAAGERQRWARSQEAITTVAGSVNWEIEHSRRRDGWRCHRRSNRSEHGGNHGCQRRDLADSFAAFTPELTGSGR
jgi:hypothetical protein